MGSIQYGSRGSIDIVDEQEFGPMETGLFQQLESEKAAS